MMDIPSATSLLVNNNFYDSEFHGANMGSIWGRQDPGGPHVGPVNFAIWDFLFRRYKIFAIILPYPYMA